MSDLPEIAQYQFCYRTEHSLLLFREDPTLASVDEVRRVLDIVTDTLIIEQLKDQVEK